jgi:hypothetical protein
MFKRQWIAMPVTAKLIVAGLIMLVCAGMGFAQETNDPNQLTGTKGKAIILTVGGGPDIDSQNDEIDVWCGYAKDGIEIGGAFRWRLFKEDRSDPNATEEESEYALGLYVGTDIGDEIKFNLKEIISFEWLPETLLAQPQIGGAALFDLEGKGAAVIPFGSLRINDILGLRYEYDFFSGDNNAKDTRKFTMNLFWKF